MTRHILFPRVFCLLGLLAACGCTASSGGGTGGGVGGGGAPASGGTTRATGGVVGSGGTATTSTGGATSPAVGTGGQSTVVATGGQTGGTGAPDAGTTAQGGAGPSGTGGAFVGSGGSRYLGGNTGAGGSTSRGGASATSTGGGGGATGGATGGASGTGGSATGGATGSRDGAIEAPVADAGPLDAPAKDGGAGSDAAARIVTFKNGDFWSDTTGTHIQAHGGGFLKVGDTWYWVGEDKTTNTGGTGNFYAVSIYASKDLVTWEHRNKIITTSTDAQLNASNRVIERPKIIYNDKTSMYVMWLHWDDTTYNNSYAGIFKSPTIDGNYTYVDHIKPGGNDSRDCTLFKEDDGTAYFISVANTNRDMFVYPLTDDYLNVQSGATGTNIFPGQAREAPAIAKISGTYYAITSQSTGWAWNQGGYSTATAITGPWSAQSNIGDNTTYQSQSTYIITVVGSQTTTYIYAGDHWNSSQLNNSQYRWLPLTISGNKMSMTYYAQWSLDLGTGVWTGN